MAVALAPTVTDVGRAGRWRVAEVAYGSVDGARIGGWLLTPASGPVERGLVVTHGYGGRDTPDFDLPVERAAVLFPVLRGLP